MVLLASLWLLAPAAAGQSPAREVLDFETAWELAWQRDPTLRGARATLQGVEERVVQARAQRLPQVSLSASYLYNDIERQQTDILGQSTKLTEDYVSRNETLQLRQALYRPALNAQRNQARAIVAQGMAQLTVQEQRLALRVMQAYLQILKSEELITLLQVQSRRAQTQQRAAERALERGVGTRTDVDEARAQRDLIVAKMIEAELQRDLARRQLVALIQQPVERLRPLNPRAALPVLAWGDEPETWVDRALANSPEVSNVRAQREVALSDVQRARTGHYPTLDAIVQVRRSRSETVTNPDAGYTNRSVGVQLQIPIYSGGQVSSTVRQALFDVERLNEALQALELELGVRVHNALSRVREGSARIDALRTALRSSEVALESAQRSFLAGTRTTLDVLDAEQRQAQVVLDLARARHDRLLALVELHSLTGDIDLAFITSLGQMFRETQEKGTE